MTRRTPLAALAALTMTLALPAHAVIFLLDGVVETCNTTVCNAAGVAIGDPITGFVEVDDAAAGPNSTFTEADVITFEVMVGDLGGGPGQSTFGPSSLTTDGDGEVESGTVNIMTSVDTILGTANVDIDLDAGTGLWEASTDFFGFGTVATGSFTLMREVIIIDTDGDSIPDAEDNCILVANEDQVDSNGDLFGNACDPDLNNDGIVNPLDLGLLRQVFFGTDADADFNGDGVVNPLDLGVMRSLFFQPPGPSGLAGP